MGSSASSFDVDPVLLAVRQIPNLISSIRILLVLPIGLALTEHQFAAAIALFGLAALSDAADGFLAKRYGWQSELGAVLDPIADKLLLVTVFITLCWLGLVPLWLVTAIVARDAAIVLGALLYRCFIGALAMRPSLASRFNTLCQVTLVLAIVVREQFSAPPASVVMVLGALVFLTVVVSGIDYMLIYGRRAFGTAQPRSARAATRAGDRPP